MLTAKFPLQQCHQIADAGTLTTDDRVQTHGMDVGPYAGRQRARNRMALSCVEWLIVLSHLIVGERNAGMQPMGLVNWITNLNLRIRLVSILARNNNLPADGQQ
jgi:hypothetical protein